MNKRLLLEDKRLWLVAVLATMTLGAFSSANAETAANAPTDTTAKDWFKIGGVTLPGRKQQDYWCKATECAKDSAFTQGQGPVPAVMYEIQCPSGAGDCIAFPVQDASKTKYWFTLKYEDFKTQPNKKRMFAYLETDKTYVHQYPGIWDGEFTYAANTPANATRRIVLRDGPPAPATAQPQTCDSVLSRICGTPIQIGNPDSASKVKACKPLQDAKDPTKPLDTAGLSKLITVEDLGDNRDDCILKVKGAFKAPAQTQVPAEPIDGDAQKAIDHLFKDMRVAGVTAEYLVKKDNKCDGESLCAWLKTFSQKNCQEKKPDTATVCSGLYEKIRKDLGVAQSEHWQLTDGRIVQEWRALFAAAKTQNPADRKNERWLRDIKDGQPLANRVIQRFDEHKIAQADLDAFYPLLVPPICQPAAGAPIPGVPSVSQGAPQVRTGLVGPTPTLTGLQANAGQDCANQPTVAAARACSGQVVGEQTGVQPVPGGTVTGPALLCANDPTGEPPPQQQPPPSNQKGPPPTPPLGYTPGAGAPGGPSGSGLQTIASLAVGAGFGAILGLCLAFGFGWPLVLGAVVGALAGGLIMGLAKNKATLFGK